MEVEEKVEEEEEVEEEERRVLALVLFTDHSGARWPGS